MPSNRPVICLSCAIWNAFSIPFDIPRIYFWYVIYLTLKIPLVNHEDTFNTYTLNTTSYTFSIPFNKTWEYLGLFIPFIYLSYPMIFLLKYFDICIYIYIFISLPCHVLAVYNFIYHEHAFGVSHLPSTYRLVTVCDCENSFIINIHVIHHWKRLIHL